MYKQTFISLNIPHTFLYNFTSAKTSTLQPQLTLSTASKPAADPKHCGYWENYGKAQGKHCV
jgi:hypothetical protein